MLLTTHGLVPSFIGQKPALQIIPLATIMHFSGTIGREKMNLIAMSICVLTILVTVSTEFSFQKIYYKLVSILLLLDSSRDSSKIELCSKVRKS